MIKNILHHFLSTSFEEQQSVRGHILRLCKNLVCASGKLKLCSGVYHIVEKFRETEIFVIFVIERQVAKKFLPAKFLSLISVLAFYNRFNVVVQASLTSLAGSQCHMPILGRDQVTKLKSRNFFLLSLLVIHENLCLRKFPAIRYLFILLV